jgi:orotate phosphoribosyltransferase
MILSKETAAITAELLVQINAIKLKPENPFTWASGWKSPIYCDNRIVLSHPSVRKQLSKAMAEQIKELYPQVEVIAGVATGAIGIGMLVAQELDLPFVYVRPEAKSHGRKNQIEGQLDQNKKVVIVEDLISTGKSSLKAADALREANANLLGMIAIFTYGFSAADDNFKAQQLSLHTLSDYDHLIEQAIASKYIDANHLQTLKQWRLSPGTWNQ